MTPSRWARGPARALQHPLTALIALVGVIGLTWALLVPPWQSPDEAVHFAYAQSLAERFALPDAKDRGPFSTDQILASDAVHALQIPFYTDQVRPDWSRSDYQRYLRAAATHPSGSNGGGLSADAANPPLFYLFDDLAYWGSLGSNALERLYAMRMWNVTLLLSAVLAGWLLSGEVFGRRRLAQLTCAAVIGLVPMQTFVLTSVNPDALMVPLWTLALWLGARVISQGAQTRDAAALCSLTAAAILTKATSYALVPPVLVALLIGWRQRPPAERRRTGQQLALASLALFVPVLGWVGLSKGLGRPVVNTIQASPGTQGHPFLVRQFLSYVWQFYLPRLPFLTPVGTSSGLALWDVWIRGGWGVFGYLEVAMPLWIYQVLAVVTGLVAAAALGLLARIRDRLRVELLTFFVLTLLSLLLLLHVSDYRSLIAGNGPLLQGRYLLPGIGLFGLAVGLATTRLPARWRGGFCGAVIVALLLLQVVALVTVAKRYYT